MKPSLLVLVVLCACAAFAGRFVPPDVELPLGVSGCCAIPFGGHEQPATAFAPKPKKHH